SGDRGGALAVPLAPGPLRDGAAPQDRERVAPPQGVMGDLLADLAFSDEQMMHDVSWVWWRWGGSGRARTGGGVEGSGRRGGVGRWTSRRRSRGRGGADGVGSTWVTPAPHPLREHRSPMQ